ncbi:MAG TPA: histidine kinase [Longimicrobium sp.]|nr:histidine kinase [Longimicrobium sp.]
MSTQTLPVAFSLPPAARAAAAGPPPPRPPRTLFGLDARTWLLIAGFWTVMALLETTKDFLSADPALEIPAWWWLVALAGNVPWWYGWLVLTPLVFALGRRYPPWGERVGANAARHFAFAIPISLFHGLTAATLWWLIARPPTDAQPLPAALMRITQTFVMSDIMIYWALLGAFAAFDYHRRFRDRELEAARLAVRAAQLETSVTEARLSALRMELNPHFLFNSLNSVSGLVRRGENPEAVQMLATLGDLLRVTLGQTDPEVPLEIELDFLRRYLDIERVRFHDRLTVEIDVPEHLLSAPVPSLLLQPLVENGVRHGIARQTGPGRLTVRARREARDLVLEVTDTGPGPNGTVRGGGVGLKNTRERLAQRYGALASLRLERITGEGGTRATVRLPLTLDEDSDADDA